MGLSFWQIAIVGAIVILLFGRGKISELMGDVAKGITSFKKGLKDDDEEAQVSEKTEAEETKSISDKSSVAEDTTVKSRDTAHS